MEYGELYLFTTTIDTSQLFLQEQGDNDAHSRAIFQHNRVSCYQNVSFVDFTEAEDDGGGGDNWGYEMSKAPVKSSPPTN